MTAPLVLLTSWLVTALVYRCLAMRAVGSLCTPPAVPAAAQAPDNSLHVVAIRPLHGVASWLEPCLESLWQETAKTRTPLVLGWADSNDPAAAVVAGIQARSSWPALVRVGQGPPGSNPKISNMIQMTSGVAADVLLQSDADVRVSPGYIAAMTAPFADPTVGLATCPYRSVPSPGLVSRVDALITNTHFLPSACLAIKLEGLHFGLGATIAVRASVLERAGGLDALLETPADDYMLARNVEAAGARLAWVPMVVEHAVGDTSWRPVLRRHLRWARVTRHVRFWGYLGQALTHGSVPALVVTAYLLMTNGSGWVALPAAWWTLQTAVLWSRRRLLGLQARDVPLLPVADLAAFLVFLNGIVGRAESS